MSILVLGKSGQLARALGRRGLRCMGRHEADLAQPDKLAEIIRNASPTAVINAAAYTAVDAAEADEAAATVINGEAPGAVARLCAELDIPFVHVSTDYVFDGSGSDPWQPDAPMAPLGAYGRSKAAGEDLIRTAGGRFAILRTAAVFAADGQNFVRTMLRLAQTRDALTVVSDQITGPTDAEDLADACISVANILLTRPDAAGTYHYSGQPAVSWADFARAIFVEASCDVTVTDIPSTDYPTPAERPKNSRLDCSTLTQTFGIPAPDWRPALRRAVAEMMKQDEL